MSCTETLKAHVSAEIKLGAKAVASREFLYREIRACDGARSGEGEHYRVDGIRRPGKEAREPHDCGKPVLMRLRDEDRLLLDARAEARGMRPATHASILLRAHLRKLTPLPKDELVALKRSIGELASIGRNINHIARAVNGGGRAPGSVQGEFRATLKICEALRDNTKALLKANVTSWETGHYSSSDFGATCQSPLPLDNASPASVTLCTLRCTCDALRPNGRPKPA